MIGFTITAQPVRASPAAAAQPPPKICLQLEVLRAAGLQDAVEEAAAWHDRGAHQSLRSQNALIQIAAQEHQ